MDECKGTTWFTSAPIIEGWYWVKHPHYGVQPRKCILVNSDMYFYGPGGMTHKIDSPNFKGCYYYGPIFPPDCPDACATL